jgi:hypothetical protein
MSNKIIFTILPSLLLNPKKAKTAPSLKASIPQISSKIPSTFLEKKNWKSFIWRKVFIPRQFETVSDDFLIAIFNLSENQINFLFFDFNLFWRDENSTGKWFLTLVKFWIVFWEFFGGYELL